MSAEESVTDALQTPVDQNAQATEDAKKMLEELQAETVDDSNATNKPESNGAASTEPKSTESDGRRQDNRGDRRGRGSDNRRGGRGGRGGGGRGANKSGRQNIKSVLTDQEKSSDHNEIRKQVEFYFSDSNLPIDKFLFEKVGGSKNNAVELSVIHSFKRMRRFEPFEAIVEALRSSELLQLTDNDTKVQRKQPLAETLDDGLSKDAVRVYEDKALPRSVYVKGFGEEMPSTQLDIEAWFTQFGPTRAVRLRRTDDKLFKRSVFAEFETEELAKKFLELDPKPKYHDKDLLIMSKKEYCDKKVDDIKSGKIAPGRDRYNKSGRGGRGGRGGFDKRRKDDDRDWRERRAEDQKNGFSDEKRSKTEAKDEVRDAELEKARAVVKQQQEGAGEAQNNESKPVQVEVNDKKREREENGNGDEEPAAKKIDTKTES